MIVLLTDFGPSEYVGIMKGVILGICPGATLVDLTHDVEPGWKGVRQGAWKLLHAYSFFPPGTVFLCVVDPGVGGARKAVAVRAGTYSFVGPDNGLIYPAAAHACLPRSEIEAVAMPISPRASRTFHGRDVFAPAAAMLEKGEALEHLGEPLAALQQLSLSPSGPGGEIVDRDRFGNLVTNLPPGTKRDYRVKVSSYDRMARLRSSYSEGAPGEVFLVTGSCGTLEISMNGASAAAATGARIGDDCLIE